MKAYRFRPDMVFDAEVELPDGPTIPQYHAFEEPPVQDGCYAVMAGGWILVEGEAPAYPPAPNPDELWSAIRTERNTKLAACDWTQLPDAPVDTAAWATYRQALRDITTQADPATIAWPEKP